MKRHPGCWCWRGSWPGVPSRFARAPAQSPRERDKRVPVPHVFQLVPDTVILLAVRTQIPLVIRFPVVSGEIRQNRRWTEWTRKPERNPTENRTIETRTTVYRTGISSPRVLVFRAILRFSRSPFSSKTLRNAAGITLLPGVAGKLPVEAGWRQLEGKSSSIPKTCVANPPPGADRYAARISFRIAESVLIVEIFIGDRFNPSLLCIGCVPS